MTINLLLFVILTACGATPKGARKAHEKGAAVHHSAAGSVYKEGANYIPSVFEREKEDTVIKGRVYFHKDHDDFRYPVRFQKLSLFKKQEKIMETATDQSGSFLMKHYLPVGVYILRMNTENFKGEMRLEVKEKEIDGVDFKVLRGQL